ncbi:MAG: BON domain-containing protein [Armatimonadetes bacterium]|nr:BON domain-containing protein [Armatimonadota bacterium]
MAVADKLKALQIKANLIADERVGLMEIEVEVQDGIATLTGDVSSEEEKRVAEELAYESEGVYEVVNDIRVVALTMEEMLICDVGDPHLGYGIIEGNVADTPFAISGAYAPPGPGVPTSEQFPGEYTDEQIDREIADRLASQDEVDVSGVRLCSANHIVFMKGVVKTADDLNRLRDMVMNIRGVTGVSSEVTVREGNTGTPL